MNMSIATIIISLVLAADPSLDTLEEQAFKQAAAFIDPSLVRIETVGGLDQISNLQLSSGPTSGLVVSEDGYVISSSFNFLSKPSTILVSLSDGRRFPANVVANDKLKLLTLLKIDASGLTPAKPAPQESIKVGQWAIAIGRTLDASTPSFSIGIISATNRIWGKALQTDAKTSPVNYGGALVDIEGRVLGVITPLSPSGNEEMSGVEWYDGGIGFAIPMFDVYEVFPRMKSGGDLLPGLLGVSYVGAPSTNVPVVIDRVRFNSPAQRAGIQTKDRIVEAGGVKIERVAQLKHLLGRMYADESLKLTLLRNEQSITVDATLAGELVPYEPPFLGILPKRGTFTEPGTIVRFVFPNSPAANAGLKSGDNIVRFENEPVSDSRGLGRAVSRLRPSDSVTIVYVRDGKDSTVQMKLASQPDSIVFELSADLQRSSPDNANPNTPVETKDKSDGKQDEKKKSEQQAPEDKSSESLKRGRWSGELAQFEHSFWAYVPEDYDPGQSYGLMVWIHPNGDVMEAEIQKRWKSICDRRRLMIVAPKADDVKRWVPGEAQFIRGLVSDIREKYSIDPSRIFLHTHDSGSLFACLLLTAQRDLFRGLALSSAPFVGRISEQEPETRQQIHFICGEGDKALPAVKTTAEALKKLKYSVTLTTGKDRSGNYPQDSEIEQLARWADCLDRI